MEPGIKWTTDHEYQISIGKGREAETQRSESHGSEPILFIAAFAAWLLILIYLTISRKRNKSIRSKSHTANVEMKMIPKSNED